MNIYYFFEELSIHVHSQLYQVPDVLNIQNLSQMLLLMMVVEVILSCYSFVLNIDKRLKTISLEAFLLYSPAFMSNVRVIELRARGIPLSVPLSLLLRTFCAD